jgi:hypothetical protein
MAMAADRGLGQGGAGRDPALLGEYRLHGFGDSVTADDWRPLGQQADEDPSCHRDHHRDRARVEVGKRRQRPAKPPVEGDVGQEGDEVDEHVGGPAGGQANDQRQRRDEIQPSRLGGRFDDGYRSAI